MEGLGVALGRTRLVERDNAAGRLVVPFDVVLPSDAGFYIVAPEETADAPKITLFRDWLVESVARDTSPSPSAVPATGAESLRSASTSRSEQASELN
jgi:DNA-binding transcriptional LysR family regulator